MDQVSKIVQDNFEKSPSKVTYIFQLSPVFQQAGRHILKSQGRITLHTSGQQCPGARDLAD